MKQAMSSNSVVGTIERARAAREPGMLFELRPRLSELLNRLGARIGRISEQQRQGQPTASEADAITQQLQTSLAMLGQLAAGLALVDAEMLPAEGAGFGSTVTLRDQDTREVAEYTLMVGSLVDLEANQVSLASPIGQALLGCVPGDEISIITPQRPRHLQVVGVQTLKDLLESNELRSASN